ncbi:VTT domain-containing protein [Acidipila sp. 4G-K13]|uniref:DedA family protein n=2 Tax=Paracidobacterium acidisoli TaxID=2303751 RepID=A0A372IMV8_9BACT|nr:VTT domain-containing protein [Paracidobacterium acidisoli]
MGIWGMGAVAFLDSSSIPVPMDLIMAGYAWADRRHFYLYVLLASAGSALGGLIPFFLGRAGGELFLLNRVERARFEQLRDRFERQEFLALLVPSLLPPPTPWKLFVFGAGVFEMRTVNFMLAVFLGRLIRFGIEAGLTVLYGPQIVTMMGVLAKRHLVATLVVLTLLFAALAWYMWQKMKSKAPVAK